MQKVIHILLFMRGLLLCSPSLLLVVTLNAVNLSAQDHHERYDSIDVTDYRFEIELNDSNDRIAACATITISFKKSLENFMLDLKNTSASGKGMTVTNITEDGMDAAFTHKGDKLKIKVDETHPGETRTYRITYRGIPADGLIISSNKFGDRTFFGDNWPDRAHNWLPTVDHPSDKATVEFIVTAPRDYRVVANGKNINEVYKGSSCSSHWKTEVPLPTKLMVIGVARFAIQDVMSVYGTPVSTWVYPQNREEGFRDFSIAGLPLAFFSQQIAPYPFSKLANVQSTTVYGGMENASCIFYHEDAVTGKEEIESLIAHEIAHQWFGDAVSEADWHHIWLSEGFATYLASLYFEDQYGRDHFVERMKKEREQVLRYATRRLAPVIDTTLNVSVDLLNPNSYEKAAWFLHMLRRELGDDLFWASLRKFFLSFEYSNALTEDFRSVVESLSGRDFDWFFAQWLYTAGHPVLSVSLDYSNLKTILRINQVQDHHVFRFPLDVRIRYKDGSSELRTLDIASSETTVSFPSGKEPAGITLDPDTWLLFENKNLIQ
jgi:aminopeptidase N